MKIKIVVIDLEIPSRVRKWALRVGIPVGVLLGEGAVAWAAGLHTWKQGDTLNAADLNGNFSALDARLTTVEGRVLPPSAFRATRTTAMSVPTSTSTPITFDSVLFDLGTEYSTTTGVFTPKNAGTYLITCETDFLSVGSSLWGAEVRDGAIELGATDIESAGAGMPMNPEVVAIVKLAAGDTVTCNAQQNTGTAQPLALRGRVTFGASRL